MQTGRRPKLRCPVGVGLGDNLDVVVDEQSRIVSLARRQRAGCRRPGDVPYGAQVESNRAWRGSLGQASRGLRLRGIRHLQPVGARALSVPMRRSTGARLQLLPPVAALVVMGLALAACRSSSDQSSIHSTRLSFTYTCCSADLVSRAWKPGETVRLRWIRVALPRSGDSGAAIVLAAQVAGPFKSVAALKSRVAGAAWRSSFAAPAIHASKPTVEVPVSVIVVPPGTPPGLYDLRTTVSGSGVKTSSDAIVHVS